MLQWQDTELQVPRLLPSLASVQALWESTWKGMMKVGLIAIEGVNAAEWLLLDIIQYVFRNPFLLALMVNPLVLEVIVKLDAFPIATGHCLLLSVTFGNFGMLCKTSCLHFIAAMANCNDGDRDMLRRVLQNNLVQIDHLLEVGELFIEAIQQSIKIVFALGGDDKVLRCICGLEVSSSVWCCFYCFFHRNLPSQLPQCFYKRSLQSALEFGSRREYGHATLPLLKRLPWGAYKMCVLYALMSMGRVFCHWLHDWLVWLEKQTGSTNGWSIAQVWLKEQHINVDIGTIPSNGTWNVKGILLEVYDNTANCDHRHFYCTHVC